MRPLKGRLTVKVLLLLVIILAFFLRIWWLDRADMTGDPSHFSFRSIRYYDFLNSNQQTTPVQWFGYLPWWSKLSFHEHPPLVFFIQFIFFNLLGVSTFIARLPFVIFGTLSVFLCYLAGKNFFHEEKIGLASSFILAVINYHVWISRSGYLEGILIFFILLNLYYFLKLLNNNSKFNYLLFGLTLGLAFLCKYTMLFLLPAYFFYLIFHVRKILINKKFLLTIVIFLTVISPVIIYNFMVLKTRGHLDLQFSRFFGLNFSHDWPMFFSAGEKNTTDFFVNFRDAINILKSALGQFYFYLFLISIILAIKNFFTNKNNKQINILLYFLIFFLLQFIFIGPSLRYLSIITGILPFFLAYLFVSNYASLKKLNFRFNKIISKIFLVICLFLGLHLILVSFNTNIKKIVTKPYIPELRTENYGFRQAEKYLNDVVWPNPFAFKTSLIVYENRLNWFCRFWYFYRLGLYDNKKSGSIEYFLDKVNAEGIDYWSKQGYKDFYYLKGVNTINDFSEKSNAIIFMEQKIEEINLQPELIYRDNGQVAFEVYYFK